MRHLTREFVMGILLGIFSSAAIGYFIVIKRIPPQKAQTLARTNTANQKLNLNQHLIEELKNNTLDLKNVEKVFWHVFSQLDNEVMVYPTENYYYFQFYANRQSISGNIRLEYGERDRGKVSFAYFSNIGKPNAPKDLHLSYGAKILSAEDGVKVTRQDAFTYVVEYKKKAVTFHLNKLAQFVPSHLRLEDKEVSFGQAFDESGYQFTLVYDKKNKQFRFVLSDVKGMPDVFQRYSNDIYVGRLSGFAFYKMHGRYVLVGVDFDNIRRNSYYDGPFDQLPDNFMTGKTFKTALEETYPYLRGKINEHGIFMNENGEMLASRVALSPYFSYRNKDELLRFVSHCRKRGPKQIILCLTRDSKQDQRLPMPPAVSQTNNQSTDKKVTH